MKSKKYKAGFTLAELLIALMVMSIVLSAVATLAFALDSANDSSSDISQKQAQLRYVTLRFSELIRHCKRICAQPGDDVVIWKSDENGDGQKNVNEIVYIEAGSDRDYLRLCLLYSDDNPTVSTTKLRSLSCKDELKASCDVTYIQMIPQCDNVDFSSHGAGGSGTKRLSVSFDLAEDGVWHNYQISAVRRSGW